MRDCDALARAFGALAVQAGATIMDVYARGCAIKTKGDGSPVSEADERAEAIILEGLSRLLPGACVIAEEQCAQGDMPLAPDEFILVDPLDGTREFISRNGEFTVNIALVSHGLPVAGAVYAPALNTLWLAGARAFKIAVAPGRPLPGEADWQAIHIRPAPVAGLTALSSRSHGDAATEAFLARLPVAENRNAGSSLKFCLIAEGKADIYPRFGPTMEWDIAAGDAVLRTAGGMTIGLDRAPVRYGNITGKHRNASFVALGDPRLAAALKFS